MNRIELINASAGSGKTYSLTNRIIEELKGDIIPEGLMATTFTNKAAAELRERIRLALLNHGKYDEAQFVLDGFVGTVNSICSRLLKEYSIDAGLSPALDVMPEEDSTSLFNIAISGVIQKYSEKLEPIAKRMSRDGSGSGYAKNSDWRDDVRAIVDLARTNNIESEDLNKFAETSWNSIKELLGKLRSDIDDEQLDRAVETATENLEKVDTPTKTTQKVIDSLRSYIRSRNMNYVIPWTEWVRLSKLTTAKDGEGLVDDVIRTAGEVIRHPDLQNDIRQMIQYIFQCAGEALSYYEQFKQKQGLMDFVDQETLVLDLIQKNQPFKSSMEDRLQLLMVDEFQDTSPIQLALFLSLNTLADKSVWVGDPKQAIYGFRGTDPQLMEETTRLLENTATLNHSWRSREKLVDFTNALFSEVFHEMGKDKVVLSIPDKRKEKAKGGWIESWNLLAVNNTDESLAIANGVKDLLERKRDLKPGDITILCRKNSNCEEISGNLESLGIRASVAHGSLLETRECRLAVAALRYLNDKKESVALAEIVHLSPMHSCHDRWLESIAKGRDWNSEWCEDPIIVSLDEFRKHLDHCTPLEAMDTAIERVQLLSSIKSWSNLSLRMANLDKLRGVCMEYIDLCRAKRKGATITGFFKYLLEVETGQAEGSGIDTVQVLTYHKAKGLEWPVVILTSLDSASKASAFDTSIVPAKNFDVTSPLDNRSIRFWPWPFGSQQNFNELDTKLENRVEDVSARDQAKKESHRLLYVGMTRARDGMVLAIRKEVRKTKTNHKTAWLDELKDKGGRRLLNLDLGAGEHMLEIGKSVLPINVMEYSTEDTGTIEPMAEDIKYLKEPEVLKEYPPARISPSSLRLSDDEIPDIDVSMVADFDCRIDIKGKPEMDAVGNAIHGFFAIDHSGVSDQRKLELVSRLLNNWGVEKAIDSKDIVNAEEKLMAFIDTTYSDAKIYREWPVSLINEQSQQIQGWIDMLIELPDGYVIIDHKSYPGTDAEEHVKQYAPQLAAYREAIMKATGKNVISTLIHLPVLGRIFSVSKH